jgi:hypothetical protein
MKTLNTLLTALFVLSLSLSAAGNPLHHNTPHGER